MLPAATWTLGTTCSAATTPSWGATTARTGATPLPEPSRSVPTTSPARKVAPRSPFQLSIVPVAGAEITIWSPSMLALSVLTNCRAVVRYE